jgi:putative transposase
VYDALGPCGCRRVPHHITQRGNARQFILGADADRRVYLDLLRQSIELHGLALVGYCLMSNQAIDEHFK